MSSNGQPTVGEQLGLGRHWAPGAPAGWSWHKLQAGGATLHVLRIETAAGVTAMALDDAGLDRFIKSAQQQKSGLLVTGDLPPDTNGNPPTTQP